MINKEEIKKALVELRKTEKKKFSQTVDLIVNLKNFDLKRESINLLIPIPHKFRDVKAAAFLNTKSNIIDSILKSDFDRYQGKAAKKLAKQYDFFIAHASIMPAVATKFGKFLGPSGKMPSPQLGIITRDDESSIKEVLNKASSSIKVKSKEASLKLAVAKEDMKDEDIAENAFTAYTSIINALPKQRENVRSVMLKFTMSKPVKLAL